MPLNLTLKVAILRFELVLIGCYVFMFLTDFTEIFREKINKNDYLRKLKAKKEKESAF